MSAASAVVSDRNDAPPAGRSSFKLPLILMLAAVVELIDGMTSAPILFGDMSEIPGPGFGGFLVKAYIASHVPLAVVALVGAATNRLRLAIIALAAVVVMNWLNYMPSVVLHGLELRGAGSIQTLTQIVAFPLMAACAIALARRNERLGLATALVTIPTVFGMLAIVLFAISVSIFGF